MMRESGEKEAQEDNDSLESRAERGPTWSSYKLLVDPVIKGGTEKLYRYDGQYFSSPNPGNLPLDYVRDPRVTRFWTKFKDMHFPVPKFKIDENYVGRPKEVTFARLNDNIKAGFLTEMCKKFGQIQEVEVLYNPKNKKHLGIAKVIFEKAREAHDAVQKLHETSVMGNLIHVELDPKGEKRMRYFQLLVSGLYTPFTLPLGEESWGPQSPSNSSDTQSEYEPVKRLTHGLLSSSLPLSSGLLGSTPFDGSTPLSMDTAYSSMHQDTPSSFWQTPQYQETPCTSPLSHSNPGTPPQGEGLSNLPQLTYTQVQSTSALKASSNMTPLISSDSQPNPPLVQLTPTMRQGAFISIIQNSRSSKGQLNLVGRSSRGGHRGRVWGSKYQNAYNRRPEHRYVHRPVFNRPKYRSGPASILVPLPPHTQTDASLLSSTQCGSGKSKPTNHLGANTSPFISTARETPVNSCTGAAENLTLPISQCARNVETQPTQAEMETQGTAFETSLRTPSTRALPCASPPCVPDLQEGHTAGTQRPDPCASPGSPAPDQALTSLDSRIQMLLGAHSSGLLQNEGISDSDDSEICTTASPSVLQSPPSPQSPDVPPTTSLPPIHSSEPEGSCGSGIEDVSPFPLPDSAEEGELSPASCKDQPETAIISSQCSGSASAPSQHTATMKPFPRDTDTSEHPFGPGASVGGSSPTPPIFRMPPPPVLLPPPGFPAIPPPILPPNVPLLHVPPPLLPPVPPRLTPPPPNLSVPPPPFFPPPKLPVGPSRWNNPPAPLPIPTRITQGKSHSMYSPHFPIPPPTGFPGVAIQRQRLPYPSTGGPATGPGYRPPWPPPLLPVFDPSVPPPGFVPVNESLHKPTVDGVLAAVAAELRNIVKKDIHRRIIEGVAFTAFDQWWDEKEQVTKITVAPVKPAEKKQPLKTRVLETWQTVEDMGLEGGALGIGLGLGPRSALRLPSFKVKRKNPSGEDCVDAKHSRPSSPGLPEDGGAKQDTHMEDKPVDESQKGTEISAVKRRHSRPLELDSDEEEEGHSGKTGDSEGHTERTLSHTDLGKEEEEDDGNQEDDDDDDGGNDEAEDEEDRKEKRLSGVSEDEDHSDKDVINTSSASSSTSSSSSEPDSDSTVSSQSDSTDSSEETLSESECESSEDEDEDEGAFAQSPVQQRVVEEIWISSDEEDAEYEVAHSPDPSSGSSLEDDLDPPLTPSAPLSDDGDLEHVLLGADPEEELRVRVFLQGYGCHDPVKQHLSDILQLPDPAVLASLQEPELQCPPSPSYKAFSSDESLEAQSEAELEDPEDTIDILEDTGNLRPPTPTGSMSESDPDLELRHRLSPPTVTEEELPHTPGAGLDMEAETPVLSPPPPTPLPPPPSPTGLHRFPSPPVYFSPPPLPSLYPAYEETPKTPGRNTKVVHISGRATTVQTSQTALFRMPMHGPFSPSFTSPSNHAGSPVPRTPGRDIVPSPPLSDHSDIRFHQREQFYGPNSAGITRYSQSSSGSSASETPSPRDRSLDQEHAKRQLNSSTNQTENSEVARLRRRKERLQHKRRMILLQKNSQKLHSLPYTASRESISKSSQDAAPGFTGELYAGQRTEAQFKKPLQGLENHVENLFQPIGAETHTVPEPQDQWRWRKRGWGSDGSPCWRRFPRRSKRREKLLLHAVWTRGVNSEEVEHLRASYERMLLQDSNCDWLSNTHWVPHPPTSVPDERPSVWKAGFRNHFTGCARSEGYYKISKRDKQRYFRQTNTTSEEPSQDPQWKNIPAQLPSSSRSGSDFRAEQRRLLSFFSCDSDLLKFNQLKFRKKKLRFSRSRIHDWGLFAEEPIAADEMVIEYVGQSIRQVIADMRERRYEQEGIGSSYLFRVDQDIIIDATKCGNLARFINHSCNPNCYAKIITVDSKKKIVIYSRQPISVNEEITYDYKFPIEDEKIPCLCGAENCRGTLN